MMGLDVNLLHYFSKIKNLYSRLRKIWNSKIKSKKTKLLKLNNYYFFSLQKQLERLLSFTFLNDNFNASTISI